MCKVDDRVKKSVSVQIEIFLILTEQKSVLRRNKFSSNKKYHRINFSFRPHVVTSNFDPGKLTHLNFEKNR